MTDLDKLIEAVEAGFPDWGLLEADIFDDPIKREIRAAYHGSLDAAESLHESLLRCWIWEKYACDGSCGHTVSVYPYPDPDENVTFNGFDDSKPARAWLIAILKAYRSQQ